MTGLAYLITTEKVLTAMVIQPTDIFGFEPTILG